MQVFNANTFTRNDLIGQYSFALSRVHRTRRDVFDESLFNHQVYRNGRLTHPKKPQVAEGLHRTVLRPGDRPPSHNVDAVDAYAKPNAKGFRPLKARTMRRGYTLEIKVYRGEHVPIMDYVAESSDPFLVKFNGVTVRTRTAKNTCSSRNGDPPAGVPPCMSENIDVQLWDWSRANPDELIATTQIRFSNLLTDHFGPMWVNFYGAPVDQSGFFGWLGDVTPHALGNAEREDTAYLGRVLLAMRAELDPAPAERVYKTPAIALKQQDFFHLRVDVYRASDVPVAWGQEIMCELSFGAQRNARQSDWCDVRRIGSGPDDDARDPERDAVRRNRVLFTVGRDEGTAKSAVRANLRPSSAWLPVWRGADPDAPRRPALLQAGAGAVPARHPEPLRARPSGRHRARRVPAVQRLRRVDGGLEGAVRVAPSASPTTRATW